MTTDQVVQLIEISFFDFQETSKKTKTTQLKRDTYTTTTPNTTTSLVDTSYTSLPFVTHLSSQVMMPIRFDFPPIDSLQLIRRRRGSDHAHRAVVVFLSSRKHSS